MTPERWQALCWADIVFAYGRTDVAAACLDLQSRYDVDILWLLVMGWLGVRRQIALSEDDLRAALDVAAPWHQQVVRPLRGIRTYMKAGEAFSSAEARMFRDRIKAEELEAERFEMRALVDWSLARWPNQRAARPGSKTTNLQLALNVSCGASDDKALAAIARALAVAVERKPTSDAE